MWDGAQQHLILHREGKDPVCLRFDEGGDDVWTPTSATIARDTRTRCTTLSTGSCTIGRLVTEEKMGCTQCDVRWRRHSPHSKGVRPESRTSAWTMPPIHRATN